MHGWIVLQAHARFNGIIWGPMWDTSHEVMLRVSSHVHKNPLQYREKLIHEGCWRLHASKSWKALQKDVQLFSVSDATDGSLALKVYQQNLYLKYY